jgi:hypothetical protein
MACGCLATRQANTRKPLFGKCQITLSSSQRSTRRYPTVLGRPNCLGGHLVVFTLNTVLIILPLCFMYPMAFRTLLNVFVLRIPIKSH